MKKKILVAVSIIAVFAVLVGFTVSGKGKSQTAIEVNTTTLEKSKLTTSVNVTGTVHSQNSTNIYSSLSYPVKSILVKVGDKVAVDDVLAELDTSSLESDIAQKRASVSSSQSTAQYNLSIAKKDLETIKFNVEKDYDTNLLNAEAAVRTAELDSESANSDLVSARKNLRTAKEDGGYSDDELDKINDAEIDKLRDTVVAKENALEKAQYNLEKAETSLRAAKMKNQEDIITSESNVKKAELSTNFSDQAIALQKLETDLAKATIKATTSGTVTSIIAKEGASGNGLLFVIEDTENLIVKTKIKEYDLQSVDLNHKVTIKADATGDEIFEGTLTYIAPTTIKSATGATQDITNAEFEAEVTVKTNSHLRIGMNTRMDIIIDEKDNVYSVPYEAIANNAEQSVIYIAKPQDDGSFIAEEIAVTTGMETDLFIEISSETLVDGMNIISDAQGLSQGAIVVFAMDMLENQAQSGGKPMRVGGGRP